MSVPETAPPPEAPPPAPPPPPPSAWRRAVVWGVRAENALAALALLLMAILPVLEILLRAAFKTGIKGSDKYVECLSLWVGFLGAMIASREKRHLALATGADKLPGVWKRIAGTFAATASAAVCTGLAWASKTLVATEMEAPARIADWLPLWVVQLILPVAFGVMALRFVWQAGGWPDRGIALAGLPLAWAVGFLLAPHAGTLLWPGVGALVVAAALGAPMFVAIGGSALLFFFSLEDGVVAAVPAETFRLVTSDFMPTIPLFTLAGFLLAEGKASARLLRLFKALFAWMPGGLAIVATLVCAFFTTFTGASGVTILALGGLLLPMLLQSGYREKFSIGLLTAAGSIGLLFPPSLPVILYAVRAKIPIPDLFAACAIPGILLVLSVAVLGLVEAKRAKVARQPFLWKEARAAFWDAKWEILLPVVPLVCIFGGLGKLVEAAAITVVYAIVAGMVRRELHPLKDLPRVLVQSITLVGGVVAIMGVAMGLTNYLIDDQVPDRVAEWVKANIHNRFLFLLALNAALIVVGAMMDIFSAIMVVVPLMLPIATQAFGINPVHLGVIFLANLELGYLVPPVGENLFLSSYRFDRPILKVAAYTVPFMIAILIAVLIITYMPGLALVESAPPPSAPELTF